MSLWGGGGGVFYCYDHKLAFHLRSFSSSAVVKKINYISQNCGLRKIQGDAQQLSHYCFSFRASFFSYFLGNVELYHFCGSSILILHQDEITYIHNDSMP